MFWAGKRIPRKLWKTRLRRNWRLQVAGAELLPAGFLLWEMLNVQKHNGSGCCCDGNIVWRRYYRRHYRRNWISVRCRKLLMPLWDEWALPVHPGRYSEKVYLPIDIQINGREWWRKKWWTVYQWHGNFYAMKKTPSESGRVLTYSAGNQYNRLCWLYAYVCSQIPAKTTAVVPSAINCLFGFWTTCQNKGKYNRCRDISDYLPTELWHTVRLSNYCCFMADYTKNGVCGRIFKFFDLSWNG